MLLHDVSCGDSPHKREDCGASPHGRGRRTKKENKDIVTRSVTGLSDFESLSVCH